MSSRTSWLALLSTLLFACGGDGSDSTDHDAIGHDASAREDAESGDPDEEDAEVDDGADASEGATDAGVARDSAVRDASTTSSRDGATTQQDAATTTRDAGVGDAGIASNTPWAPFVWSGTGPRDGLTMIASNITQEPVGGAVSVVWLFVIRNGGTQPVCSAIVRGGFVNAAGTEILKVIGTPDALPHLPSGATAVAKCLPPGASIGGYAATSIATAVDLKLAKELRYSVTGVTQAGAVLQTSPMLASSKIVTTSTGTAVEGSVVSGARSVRFLSYKLYPLDARGMPLKRLMVYHSAETSRPDDVFPASTTWTFTSESQAEPFSTYLLHLDFQL